jgi:hypothetical protein
MNTNNGISPPQAAEILHSVAMGNNTSSFNSSGQMDTLASVPRMTSHERFPPFTAVCALLLRIFG